MAFDEVQPGKSGEPSLVEIGDRRSGRLMPADPPAKNMTPKG
jgi:hypothetical protein